MTIIIASVPDASALSSFFSPTSFHILFHRVMSFRPEALSKKLYPLLVACKKQRDARPYGFKNRIKSLQIAANHLLKSRLFSKSHPKGTGILHGPFIWPKYAETAGYQ